ncbi:MAG: PadR family transcriptional regulator [Promethearchaeota archaeon]
MNNFIKKINPVSRFKKGSIIVHILYHADKEPFYGSWLKEELARHGYKISDGTLYPWLKRLHASGFLNLKKKIIDGKIRKYYAITGKGKKAFEEIKKYLNELVLEVMEKK